MELRDAFCYNKNLYATVLVTRHSRSFKEMIFLNISYILAININKRQYLLE